MLLTQAARSCTVPVLSPALCQGRTPLLQHRAAGTKSPRCQSVFPPGQEQMAAMYGITSMAAPVASRSPRPRHQPRGAARQSRCNPHGIWIPQCGITPNTTSGGTTKGLVRSCVAPRQAAPSPVLPACGHPIPSSHQPLPKGLCSALSSAQCLEQGWGTPQIQQQTNRDTSGKGEQPWCLLPSCTQGWLSRRPNAKPA